MKGQNDETPKKRVQEYTKRSIHVANRIGNRNHSEYSHLLETEDHNAINVRQR